jgi:hypothetical protein
VSTAVIAARFTPPYTSAGVWLPTMTQSPAAGVVDNGDSTSNAVVAAVVSSGAEPAAVVSASLR